MAPCIQDTTLIWTVPTITTMYMLRDMHYNYYGLKSISEASI